MGRTLIRCFIVTMVPNKERRHGNVSTLMCYFWQGVLVYLGSGWDRAALEGNSSCWGCLWQMKTQVTCWQPPAKGDAEASVEQTGSCCRVCPVPATLRQPGATFSFNKVEVWSIQGGSEPHTCELTLDSTLCLPSCIPRWYFRRSKADDLPWLFCRLHLTVVLCLCGYTSQAHHTHTVFPLPSNMHLNASCFCTKSPSILRNWEFFLFLIWIVDIIISMNDW